MLYPLRLRVLRDGHRPSRLNGRNLERLNFSAGLGFVIRILYALYTLNTLYTFKVTGRALNINCWTMPCPTTCPSPHARVSLWFGTVKKTMHPSRHPSELAHRRCSFEFYERGRMRGPVRQVGRLCSSIVLQRNWLLEERAASWCSQVKYQLEVECEIRTQGL
jgi:hypothetical protein